MSQVILPIAKDLIIGAMKVVTSADKAYRWLREQGYTFTRKVVRESWKIVGEKDMWSTVSKTYGTDRPIPRPWVIDMESKEAEGLYHRIKVTYQDIETGEYSEKIVSERLEKRTAYDSVYDDLSDDISTYSILEGKRVIDWTPAGIVRLTPKR